MFNYALKSKFLGGMVGAAVGDAVGAFFEGKRKVSVEEILNTIRKVSKLRYTDDTQMTIGLAESIIRSEGVDAEDLVKTFIRNFDPSRGYGWGTSTILRKVSLGGDWRVLSRKIFGGVGSFGNGAAMRVSPVGLFYYDDSDKLREAAQLSSLITHSNPLGVEGAIIQAFTVSMAVKAKPGDGINRMGFLDSLLTETRSVVFRSRIESIKDLLVKEPSRSDVIEVLGNSVESYNSVPTAIYMFLKESENFSEAVLNAICLGGDTDTIASMVGASSGAYLGLESIPKEWVEKLEDAGYIIELAEKLYETKMHLT